MAINMIMIKALNYNLYIYKKKNENNNMKHLRFKNEETIEKIKKKV